MKATIVFEQNWNAIKQGYRYIVNRGSSRSSKTHSLIQLFYLYAMENPGSKCAVFRDTKQSCRLTVFEDMRKIYPSMPNYHLVTINLTDTVFKFSNGSSIHIEGTDDSIKIHGYHSDLLWLNEPYGIGKETADQLEMRCAGHILYDLNPRQDHWTDNVEKDEQALLIESTFRDNPFCPPEQRKKILSYQPVSMCDVILSELLTEPEANTYDFINNPKELSEKQLTELIRCLENQRKNSASKFNWEVYGLGKKSARPNRIFNWNEIGYQEYLQIDAELYYGVDWGAVDPWGILEAKYYDGTLYLHELNYKSENTIKGEMSQTELINTMMMDEGIVTWMFNKLGIDTTKTIICDNNRESKIVALRNAGWEYAIKAIKPPGSIIDGIDLLNNINICYTSTSENIKYEQENYCRKVDRYGIVMEEPGDNNNHLIDPARYIAQFLQSLGIIRNI